MSAELEVRTLGRIRIAAVRGGGPFAGQAELRERLLEEVAGSKFVVVDLSGLDRLDWDDLGLLVAARKAHQARWGTHMHVFKLVAPPGGLRQMLQAMQLEHVLPTYRSLADALASFPSRRVLLLEPDDAVASAVEILLEANGFEVIRARDPAELPASGGGDFDLALAALRSPDDPERGVVRRLRLELGCPVGVLREAGGPVADLAAFALEKPIDPVRLLQAVREALERPLRDYYENILDLLPVALATVRAGGEAVRVNRAWRQLFRVSAAEPPAPPLASLLPGAVEPRALLEAAAQVARTGAGAELEVALGGEGAPRLLARLESIDPRGGPAEVLVSLVPLAPGEEARAAGGRERESAEVREVMLSLLEDLDGARLEASRANRRLEELDRLKSEFVSTVSHELRTPITAVRGSVENLLDGLHGRVEPRQRRTLEVVLRNSKRLAHLIDNLLDLARLEAGELQIRRRRADLREPVRHAVEDVHALVEKLGIQLRVELPPEPFRVECDPDRMTQVVINLLDNALRFARSRVAIVLDGSGSDARLAVEDDGPGIPEADLERIFDRFAYVREHADRTNTGLGLSIVRGIVEAHNGRVWAERKGGGLGGARLVIVLPLVREEAREEPDPGRGGAAIEAEP